VVAGFIPRLSSPVIQPPAPVLGKPLGDAIAHDGSAAFRRFPRQPDRLPVARMERSTDRLPECLVGRPRTDLDPREFAGDYGADRGAF
jgi:hypothetical protein